jgi:hypothetical protein
VSPPTANPVRSFTDPYNTVSRERRRHPIWMLKGKLKRYIRRRTGRIESRTKEDNTVNVWKKKSGDGMELDDPAIHIRRHVTLKTEKIYKKADREDRVEKKEDNTVNVWKKRSGDGMELYDPA